MPALARNTDPKTSHRAAKSLSEDHLNRCHEAVYEVLAACGPMCDLQLVEVYKSIQEDMGYPIQRDSSIRTRRRELADIGMVVDTGQEVKYNSSRASIVWSIS